MKIYLISLKHDELRRSKLSVKFLKKYKDMQCIQAVNGKELLAKNYFFYLHQFFSKFNKIITPSELGCTLSHIKALEVFLDTEEKYCLILEDDVVGSDSDILLLENIFSNIDLQGIFILRDQSNFGFEKYIFGRKLKFFYEIPEFSVKFIFGACSYVVDRETAKALVDYHSKTLDIADLWYKINKKINKKIYYYPLFIHPEDLSDSNIEEERSKFFNNKIFVKRLLDQRIFGKVFNRFRNDFYRFFLVFNGYRQIHKDGKNDY
ncbi:glycosyltransferase family 25 protein [Acinetobacter sp. SwsAc6]|uniref:glycosyltransferase family 25 protein n=1 Tax=Acinetobacter sp. SwsAc6 TaxID=2749439 RepID=UPI0015B90E29|nr:glycosyltransferase family 25 protein [Acinetobacter sp. SwsAc6]NWK72818.1 glycosyltransferase family 25 protein [Acinetobacter sp. SwsAc6]